MQETSTTVVLSVETDADRMWADESHQLLTALYSVYSYNKFRLSANAIMKVLSIDTVHGELLGHTEFSTMVETRRLGSGTCQEARLPQKSLLPSLNLTLPPVFCFPNSSPRFCSNSLKSR